MTETYRQCTLNRGYYEQTAWIPSKFAVVGKVLRIGGEDGWKVTEAGTVELTQEEAVRNRDQYRNAFASIYYDKELP